MAERLKAQHWKCCLGEILTRVRISLSPPFILRLSESKTCSDAVLIYLKNGELVDVSYNGRRIYGKNLRIHIKQAAVDWHVSISGTVCVK